jgi:hypothetical protein
MAITKTPTPMIGRIGCLLILIVVIAAILAWKQLTLP